MRTSIASLAVVSAVAIPLCLSAPSGFAATSPTPDGMTVAEGEKTAPAPAPSQGGKEQVLEPKQYPETPAEVKECMSSWDASSGMSKEEYAEACKRTLKYFPEKGN